MQDPLGEQEFTGCWFPDCGVLVPKTVAPREPLCLTHIELLIRSACEFDEGPAQDEAMREVRRRVLGLE